MQQDGFEPLFSTVYGCDDARAHQDTFTPSDFSLLYGFINSKPHYWGLSVVVHVFVLSLIFSGCLQYHLMIDYISLL